MTTDADKQYQDLVTKILTLGDNVITRNHGVFRSFTQNSMIFDSLPLVTLRPTAAKKALKEMEWFMSGDSKCPDDLKDWWAGQLSEHGNYIHGYPQQLRNSPDSCWMRFDQIKYALDGIKNSPFSRRLCLTTWNPGDMAMITQDNGNPQTPSTCHLSFVQFFVDTHNKVHMLQIQRSADVLLGVPHNLIQHWSLLTFLAHHSGRQVGTYQWLGGDCHIYNEPSHLEVANIIKDYNIESHSRHTPFLEYKYSGGHTNTIYDGVPDFIASDFKIVGEVPEPITRIRPKLL
jgi:thymidylate synthase